MPEADDLYITVEEVAQRLRLSARQAARYSDKIPTRKSGKRVMFLASAVDALAEEMHVDYRPPPIPRAELAPASVLMDRNREQEDRILSLGIEVGRLQGILQERETAQRVLTDDKMTLQRKLDEALAEIARLKEAQQVAPQQHRSWLHRLLDR
jgi:hypothetical protein